MTKTKAHLNGTGFSAIPSITTALLAVGAVSVHGSADYGPAVWRPAYNGHWYTSGYGKKFYVEHDIEGYYWSCISYFQQSGTQASVHYTINGKKDNSSDANPGEVTQMVADANYAWHATCWNQHSMGTEHEGFVSNPAWFTPELYQSSADLTRAKANKYGFPKTRNYIVGHNEKSNGAWASWAGPNLGINAYCNTHSDPGPYWDWNGFMAKINNTSSGKKKGDINGDGKSDLTTFTRGSTADVYVSLASGNGFYPSQLWYDGFAGGTEVPLVGDVNGDGKADLVTFTRGTAGWVVVALASGTGFYPSQIWATGFCMGTEIPALGDVNGDGKEDILTFTRGTSGWVGVALSTGGGFGSAAIWKTGFCMGSEIPVVGDVTGDGKADIMTFTRGTSGWVVVGRSTGGSFDNGVIWTTGFCLGNEIPSFGDFNGDGKQDIVTFTQGSPGYVWVALSNGGGFNSPGVWHGNFSLAGEVPGVGDFNGDGKDDIVTFTRGSTADVWVALSNGGAFGGSMKWHDWFCAGTEIPAPAQALFFW